MDEYEQGQENKPSSEDYQQPAQQEWQQTQQPQQPPRDLFKDMSSNRTITMVVILGLLILMVGAILVNATNSIDDSRHVLTIGNILKDLGVFMISAIMLIAAIYRDDWSKWIRIAVFGFALVMIIVGYYWFAGTIVPEVEFGWPN